MLAKVPGKPSAGLLTVFNKDICANYLQKHTSKWDHCCSSSESLSWPNKPFTQHRVLPSLLHDLSLTAITVFCFIFFNSCNVGYHAIVMQL